VKKKVFNILTKQNGGIGTVIAVLITTILVLGLISTVILNQVTGARQTGEKAISEQQKINLMLENPNIVTGSTVKDYISMSNVSAAGISVTINGSSYDEKVNNVNESALYEMEQTYGADGKLEKVNFKLIDLGRTK